MADNYYDSMIDCALMIGVNEYTGLKISKNEKSENHFSIQGNFQQHILAAISSTIAIFPFCKETYQYPPVEFEKTKLPINKQTKTPVYNRQYSREDFHMIHDLVNQYNNTDITDQFTNPELEKSFRKRYSKCSIRRKSIRQISLETYKGSLGSVSIETIKNFPATYFNNNLKLSKTYVEPIFEILPMTDNLGNRSYAFRLEFHRQFKVKINNSEETNNSKDFLIEAVFETDIDSSNEVVFIPCNIVFFSKYPYFNMFNDISNQLFLSINNKSNKFIEEELMEYSSILSRIPIMKMENIQINFNINETTYSVKSNNPIYQQIIDWDMSVLFQILSLNCIISLIIAMFQEHKIAFFSRFPNIITISCETLLVLFQPFTWKHFYLPVVPSHLYELVDAIFPFLLGLPHNLKENVIKGYTDIIVVDLDEGSISIPTGCEIMNISKKLQKELKENLKDRCWLKFRESFFNIVTVNPGKYWNNLNEISNKKFSEKIMKQFMITMVDLFQEILINITFERSNDEIVANVSKYLATTNSENVEFFKAIYRNDHFNCFLDNKLKKEESDGWTKVCDKLYPGLLDYFQTSRSERPRIGQKVFERNKQFELNNDEKYLEINLQTSRYNRNNYYKNTIDSIDNLQNHITLLKFKAEIFLQMGDKIEALSLINQALLLNKSSIDFSKIKKLVKGMDKVLKKELESTNVYRSLIGFVTFNEKHEKYSEKIKQTAVHHFNPPNKPITKAEFLDTCKKGNITDYENTVNALFKCFTLDQKSSRKHSKLIPCDLFQCFYANWIQCVSHFNENDINLNEFLDEILIITTNSKVKVDDIGQGRLILTQIRLLLIPFGKRSLIPIVDFSKDNITKIKSNRKIRGFGKLAEVLEISRANNSKPIVIWMSEDIEIWFNLITEIYLGNRLAIEEKDDMITQKMTDQCLVYENLANCSRLNPYFKKHALDISKIMLTFSNNSSEMNRNNQLGTINHRKYLITKLSPSPKQDITIDFVLFITKSNLNTSDLWCAIGYNDKFSIKIFQKFMHKSLTLCEQEMEVCARIKFMMHLEGSNKVMVACHNGTILLINVIDYVAEELTIFNGLNTLTNCGVCYHEHFNFHLIYLGNSDGSVIKCDSKFKMLNKIISIPGNHSINFMEMIDYDTLAVCSSNQFFIITTSGEILSTVEIFQMIIFLNRISFMGFRSSHKNLIFGLARLPVLIEYDISNKIKPFCLRSKTLNNNKDILPKDLSGVNELPSKSVGISCILNIPTNDNIFWVVYKDGTVEIRNYKTLDKIDNFNAHNGAMTGGQICEIDNKFTVITIGKDDGKVILWNTTGL